MKHLKKRLLVFIALWIWLYIISAVSAWDLNIANWEVKGGFAFFGGLIWPIVVLSIPNNFFEKKLKL